MKTIFLLLLTLLTHSILFGQVNITNDEDGTVVNGDTVYVTDSQSHINVYLHVKNTSSTTTNYSLKKTILYFTGQLPSDALKTSEICYPTTGTVWTAYSTEQLSSGDSMIFNPKIIPLNGGEFHYRYYILDADNGDIAIDSVDVKLISLLSIGNSAIDFSVYPNPVNDVLNITISENNTSIALFDIVGKNVTEMELMNGNNTLNIENLKPGIYFYSIKKGRDIIETEKIIVR
jgi:hypothetical protein